MSKEHNNNNNIKNHFILDKYYFNFFLSFFLYMYNMNVSSYKNIIKWIETTVKINQNFWQLHLINQSESFKFAYY